MNLLDVTTLYLQIAPFILEVLQPLLVQFLAVAHVCTHVSVLILYCNVDVFVGAECVRSVLVDTGMFYANEERCMLGLPVERHRLAGEWTTR